MTLKTSTMKPGLLVALRTTVTGNARYLKRVLNEGTTDSMGRLHEEWQTEKIVSDPEEYKAANDIRGRVCGWVVTACIQTSFGLLCPENNVDNMERAYADALREVNLFNEKAQVTRINLNMITGRIANNDAEAIRAINVEVRGLIEEMTGAVEKLDVNAIRNAATRAKNVSKMLTPAAEERLGEAIKTARGVATRLNKAGEQAAVAVDQEAVAALMRARAEFLDLDDDVAIEASGVAPDARAYDLEPEAVPTPLGEDDTTERAREENRERAFLHTIDDEFLD
jgi:hypothetical protein